MKNISLKDIARMAQVSPTTVSFVLNGKARERRISVEVIERVEKLVARLEYRPNQMARGLRTGKTKTIGLMVEDISNHFFATLAKVIEDEAHRYGYEVLFCSTEDKDDRAVNLLRMLKYRQVDGFVLTPTAALRKDIEALLEENKAFVLIDRYFPTLDTSYVVVDNCLGAYMATSHLFKQGYRRLAIITTASKQWQMEERKKGFFKAVKEHELPQSHYSELSIPFNEASGKAIDTIARFLSSSKPDGVFFATNYLGIYGLEAIRMLDWKIPSKLGVVCFDDHAAFHLFRPGITCIAQPLQKMGACVMKALMSSIKEDKKNDVLQYTLEPELIVRGSCREKTGARELVKTP